MSQNISEIQQAGDPASNENSPCNLDILVTIP